MALLTLHRTPSVCTTPDEPIPRLGRLQKRESFALVKGAVLLLDEREREGLQEEPIHPLLGPRHGGQSSDTQRRHLHAMISLLRPEDTVKLAVRLESVSSIRVRYLLIVGTLNEKEESMLLGMDFRDSNSDECTIGLVLPIWSDTQVYLDGDGGFSVTSAEATRIFKPVSIQTMWSVLQALHGCCERAVRGAVIPGCGLEWAQYYREHVESNQHCLNEWGAMTGLESVRTDTGGSSTSNRVSMEREIKAQLREIMRTEDLENITSKQVRTAMEARIGIDMKDYKEYIDNEMMVTMAQMDKPSRILDYLYLGSEWNAANFEELQKNNVGYILNVTMEIDNFFPQSFTYMNIRVYDVESTDLLAHWNSTYTFIDEARKRGQAVLVHCKMGVSRSASTVIAFVMKQQGWTLDHALNYVRERRPIVQPNEGFLKQLQTYSGILNASKQRHSALWRRKSKPDVRQPSVHNTPATESRHEQKEEEEEEELESPEEEESSEEEEETDVFDEQLDESVPDMPVLETATTNPLITVQDSDKVSSSPSRSGRMDLFSLMQSIQLDDEDRGIDKEIPFGQRHSPAQRRRSHRRRELTHQKAHVDVSPDPSSRQAQNKKPDEMGL
ncbi:protein phosphatase Slingshot homolog 3-like isoform X2 [Xyrauchen texanus]|uniref:protein phosphatase Slingshot homolog 3-like isoform X2 n=1 Tax=Xyrauchen texanus TaxID=154827 RepID=UPI002241F64A|nr:protein phosphatase Slingshot homolog 3-like isoform X2 [Xyrauchen texanus]